MGKVCSAFASLESQFGNWNRLTEQILERSEHELISGRWFFVAAFRRKRLLHLVFILLEAAASAAAAVQKTVKRNSNKDLRPGSKSPKWNQKIKYSANEKLHLPVRWEGLGGLGGLGAGDLFAHAGRNLSAFKHNCYK